ncbi:GSCOCG00004701001-RA-CDS [Cotesia congregata]|uniref:NADH dehydrogenase [ubiquinone] 1 beta subcomplex subunit 5, mitochondrial n=1 Tax=Cotesia congregata TaxID=51543 RepID=A0A8J2MRT3_COTCN|nr:GSCOCG00004701001-RA-CDS [Cotesia congregata]CAG5092140.1 Similar to NDUFB5: NADH dehydrogenase [ubiquinone] 1 beta subcomplex subunit 5 [Cotesia congregata]
MAAWSGLLRNTGQILSASKLIKPSQPLQNAVTRYMSGGHHRVFPLGPSRWHWHKTKDLLHFYTLIGVVPLSIAVFCINVFIGPATLKEIPEGYEPKHWEYYRHPISRWLARYVFPSDQQEYEKQMFFIWEEQEKQKLRKLENKIHNLMNERIDYQYYYYEPYTNAQYVRRQAQGEQDQQIYSQPFE